MEFVCRLGITKGSLLEDRYGSMSSSPLPYRYISFEGMRWARGEYGWPLEDPCDPLYFLRDVFTYFAKKDDKGVARITLSLFIRKTVAFPFWKDITWDDYSEK